MTETQFNKELIDYVSDLLVTDKQVVRIEFYLNLQPGLVSYGGHSILAENESIPLDIRRKGKSSNADFVDKIKSFHQYTTNGGQNKRNKVLFRIDTGGQVESEFTWDEDWEQKEIDAYKGQVDSVRQKWYWEEI